MLWLALAAASLPVAKARLDVAAPQNSGSVRYQPVNLSQLYTNQGVASNAQQLAQNSFDTRGNGFSAADFPTGLNFMYNIPYQWKSVYGDGNFDNILCGGDTINVTQGRYYSLKVLMVNDVDSSVWSHQESGTFQFNYADGSTSQVTVSVPQWLSPNYIPWSDWHGEHYWSYPNTNLLGGGALCTGCSPQDRPQLFNLEIPISTTSPLVSFNVPQSNNDGIGNHLFAATLVTTPKLASSSTSNKPAVFVESVQATQRWDDINGTRVQYIEVTIVNTAGKANSSSSYARGLTVELTSHTAKSAIPVSVMRLANGQFLRVDVPITGGTGSNDNATITIRNSKGKIISQSAGWTYQPGLTDYVNTDASLQRYQAPNWWRDAKLGIMWHWGPYSVPAYGGGDNYAEWYMWGMRGQWAYDYHKNTYGIKFPYDGFFRNFTASNWDVDDWVNLMTDAGGKYMVGTTKHHDGFALFDTEKTTNRSALHYGPKKDLIATLSAAMNNSDVKFGTYFSLPEWYNPLYTKYAQGAWQGGPPVNPYTGKVIPYTGYIHKKDFVDDIMTPQMDTLMLDNRYYSNIMWCDIGGASRACEGAVEYFNEGRKRGQNIVMNNRCGCMWNAHTTPEYTSYPGIVQQPWETNEGLAPFSYGYDKTVPAQDYKTAYDLIATLIDIVSKNGNFLIDFGPDATGVISEPQVTALQGLGAWLKQNGDAIYGTRYWSLAIPAEQGPGVGWRFTTKNGAFYFLTGDQPPSTYTFTSPIPIMYGDKITALGDNSPVAYTVNANNQLTISLTDSQISAGAPVWAYKIAFA